ncbi:unnamed protein product [Cuscuta campestris]|uniref:Receptor-like serine/threonine-protein kinase n=1 Tax=Cuscuta campestris TaxID=132261 RepID=A0A484M0J6_9ASTE|nr:unnamed protein product [Cuscuta campestris]
MKPHSYRSLCFFIIPHLLISIANAVDTITPAHPLTGNQTLVSAGELFELGFFASGDSGHRYVGIWYKKIKDRTVVWVANRDNPLMDSAGILKIGEDGNIHLIDSAGDSIWSSSWNRTDTSVPRNIFAQLLDSGNFVLAGETGDYLWQSFDYPTDTLLPGMKLGWDSKTGINRYISSWKSPKDPGQGDISFKLDINGYPEAFLRNKDLIFYRSGAWNGVRFSGVPEMETEGVISFSFKMTKDEIYYTFQIQNQTLYSRLIVNQTEFLERYTWVPESEIWNRFWYAPKDQCDEYRECGPFGRCDADGSPVCQCLTGFKPRNKQAWDLRDGSDGCVRVKELGCGGDGFIAWNYTKLPESGGAFVDEGMRLDECEKMCVGNCSCTAYSSANVSGGSGSGCVIWTAELLDMRKFPAEGDQLLYVRVAAFDAEQNGNAKKSGQRFGKTKEIILACSITLGIALILFSLFMWEKRRTRRAFAANIYLRGIGERSGDLLMNGTVISKKTELSRETLKETDELELPLFDLGTIVVATNNFSSENKLGRGGFGCVYKGRLISGEEIAVKRLSEKSRQGVGEFKNELRLIAKLQHRNLVRLLGCCVDNEEKMLVYEYMENKSLDSLLFDKEKSSMLDWRRRFNIIYGIARGLLYLHQDSRFRIIHRDLKASNVLLDKEMNPKISDFGMARIFGDETDAKTTKRVVGTYGYMSPEYAMDGLFSMKSDVFSFGVLVLEVVTGKKNRGFYQQKDNDNLLGLAWKLWKEGRGCELLDSSLSAETHSEFNNNQVLRSIQVGLLCVQEKAEDRPTMAAVILMLRSEEVLLPQPKQPGFCLGSRPLKTDSSSSVYNDQTSNELTITKLDGR